MKGAIYCEDSGNSKIIGSQKADATYASIQGSCPDSCALKAHGCYAQDGWTGLTVRRLDAEAVGQDVTAAEVSAIDASYNSGKVPSGRALRLHVSGDARTVKAARALSAAVKRWQKRGGGKALTYTHAWRTVGRSAWSQSVSVRSSSRVTQATRRTSPTAFAGFLAPRRRVTWAAPIADCASTRTRFSSARRELRSRRTARDAARGWQNEC